MTYALHKDQPGYRHVLDNMHRDRKRVFVDLLKWDVPVIDGQFEVDQFDTDEAVYLIAAEDDGRHRGSVRLLPTTGPHLLGAIFPQLCEKGVPTGPDIWELSRGCFSPRLRATERRRVRYQVQTSFVDYGLLHGIKGYTAIAEISWLSQLLAMGWICEPLGLPQWVNGELIGAVLIHVSPATPHLMRNAGTHVPSDLYLPIDMPIAA